MGRVGDIRDDSGFACWEFYSVVASRTRSSVFWGLGRVERELSYFTGGPPVPHSGRAIGSRNPRRQLWAIRAKAVTQSRSPTRRWGVAKGELNGGRSRAAHGWIIWRSAHSDASVRKYDAAMMAAMAWVVRPWR